MKTRKASLGQALVEFALVIPLLIFMFIAFIDLGRAIFFYAELSNAVREGTRYAIVHSTCADGAESAIINVVSHYSASLNPADMTVVITPSLTPDHSKTPPSCPVIDDMKVTVSGRYIYRPITPGLQALLGPSNVISLEAHSTASVAPLYQR